MNWPKRLYLLDISRGLASLSVVIWHWQHFYYEGTASPIDFDRTVQPAYQILKPLYEAGGKGVEFFFLLSGFIFFWLYYNRIKANKVSNKKFWVARFSRLYPLHFATLLIVAVLQLYYLKNTGDYFVYANNDLYHFILNAAYVNQWGFEKGWSYNAPVWSVSIEIFLYLIFFLIAKKKLANLWICLGLSLISFVCRILVYHPVFIGSTSFFLGGGIYFLINNYKLAKNLKITFVLVGLFSWVAVIVHFYIYPLTELLDSMGVAGKALKISFIELILFPTTLASLIFIELKLTANKKAMNVIKKNSWIGDITYSTYLLHFPLQMIFGVLVVNSFINKGFQSQAIWLIIFLTILIVLSYLTFKVFERPMQNWIRKRFEKEQ